MKTKLLLIVSLFLMLVPTASADSLPLTETYVDPDGLVMLNLPTNWRVVQSELSNTIIIPNTNTEISFSVEDYGETPVETLTFFADIYETEVEEITINDRPAARMIEQSYFWTVYYAVNYAEDYILRLSFIGSRGEFFAREDTLLAILESAKIPTEEEMPEEEALAEALELGANFENFGISFDYPKSWFIGSYQTKIALSNVSRWAQYREPEYINPTGDEIALMIFPDTESLPGIIKALMDENDDSAEDIALLIAIDVLVEAGTSGWPDIDETTINNQAATFTPLYGEDEDYLVVTLELDNGNIASIVAIVPAGKLVDYQTTVEAIAESLVVVE